jgi:SOS-response transcriptional repressor LexA
MTGGLTKTQARALNFIARYIVTHGVAPTYDEIAAELDLSSKSSVNRILTGLEERGRIRKFANRARGIEIIERTDSAFLLARIVDAVQSRGLIGKDDPLIAEAVAAVGERHARHGS